MMRWRRTRRTVNKTSPVTTGKGIGSFFAGYPTGGGGHQYYQQPYGFPPPTRPYGSYPPPGVISFPPSSTAYPSYQPNYFSSVDPPIAYPYPAAPGYPFASYPYAAPPSYYPSAAYPAFSCCPPGFCPPAPAPPSYYSGQHYYGRGG